MLSQRPLEVLLAQPRGFCAGVVRAIEIVERALDKYGAPVYVRHEIVHNKYVVESLKAKGAIFVEELSEVPPHAVTVFSAHGVAKSIEEEAASRGLPVLNATCPLVTKVHNQGKRYMAKGRALILIGHAGHPEVVGTMGQVPGPVHLVQNVEDVAVLTLPTDTPVAYITQTTLSVDDTRDIIAALEQRFKRYSRPGHPGYLLCDTEPPICGKRPQQARGCHPGGRSDQQFELQSVARDRHRGRCCQLPDRRRQRAQSGMVKGCQGRGCHGWRIGARSAC
ncbi:(E)-4-hydroxy-3-methyl-but-2-enyl pyrophosphate reductase [Nitrobacteraceae bacterium AZCC 2299]